MEYVDVSNLLSGFGLIVFIADSLARSSLTKVVSLDLILYGLWKVKFCEERSDELKRHLHEIIDVHT